MTTPKGTWEENIGRNLGSFRLQGSGPYFGESDMVWCATSCIIDTYFNSHVLYCTHIYNSMYFTVLKFIIQPTLFIYFIILLIVNLNL